MSRNSPEHMGSVDRLAIVALFAGILAVGSSLFKHVFNPDKKSKEK